MIKILKENEENITDNKIAQMSTELIPALRLSEILSRVDMIMEGYEQIQRELSQKQILDIRLDIVRIESSLKNIEELISNELKYRLINKF